MVVQPRWSRLEATAARPRKADLPFMELFSSNSSTSPRMIKDINPVEEVDMEVVPLVDSVVDMVVVEEEEVAAATEEAEEEEEIVTVAEEEDLEEEVEEDLEAEAEVEVLVVEEVVVVVEAMVVEEEEAAVEVLEAAAAADVAEVLSVLPLMRTFDGANYLSQSLTRTFIFDWAMSTLQLLRARMKKLQSIVAEMNLKCPRRVNAQSQ